MRADYDSEANALDLELVRFEHYDDQEQVDDDFCTVGFADRLVTMDLSQSSPPDPRHGVETLR